MCQAFDFVCFGARNEGSVVAAGNRLHVVSEIGNLARHAPTHHKRCDNGDAQRRQTGRTKRQKGRANDSKGLVGRLGDQCGPAQIANRGCRADVVDAVESEQFRLSPIYRGRTQQRQLADILLAQAAVTVRVTDNLPVPIDNDGQHIARATNFTRKAGYLVQTELANQQCSLRRTARSHQRHWNGDGHDDVATL